ncbi:MAG: hypothetical protein ACK41F_14105, partial [Fimbriimonadaceae bacterium]
MLVPLAAATVLFSAAAPTPTGGRVVAASLFKNGYAVVVREIPVTDGKATVGEVPRASLGTLWFVPAEGARLRSVVSTVVKSKSTMPVSSLEEVLAANVGQTVQVAFATEDPALGKSQTGRIISAEGQLLVLRTSAGTVAVPKGGIRSVLSASGSLKWQKEVETTKRVVRIETEGGPSGKVL